MAFGNSLQQDMMSEINVTPLVDVMLVLLVVFIITAPLLTPQSLKITLPRTAALPSDNRQLPVHLVVDARGQVEMDGRVVTDAELGNILRKRAADPALQVRIDADQSAPYGRVAQLMALAQQAGVTRLAFTTLAAR
jgi:biopolymer transport protein ExbD